MSESNHPIPPTPLTPSGTRAVAAAMCRAALPDLLPPTATAAVDALDAITGALLVTTLGLSPIEARAVLAYVWAQR